MSLELIIVIIAAVAVVGLVGLSIRVRNTPADPEPLKPAQRPGPFDGARDVIDRSIGMYVIRRLTGRSAEPPPRAH